MCNIQLVAICSEAMGTLGTLGALGRRPTVGILSQNKHGTCRLRHLVNNGGHTAACATVQRVEPESVCRL